MAEIGIIASVAQIADVGLRLIIKLYSFGEIVASADKAIVSISKDVSLTSSVLQELGQLLEKDKETHLFSENAVLTADSVVKECLDVFQGIESILVKKLPNLRTQDGKGSRPVILLERLKWSYLQPKLYLLRSNLDRLKSTLLLMLNVITYARQVSGRTESPSAIADQRILIEDLARSNQEYIHKFESLKLRVESRTLDGMEKPRGMESSDLIISKPVVRPEYFSNFLVNDTIQQNPSTQGQEKPRGDLQPELKKDTLLEQLEHYSTLFQSLLDEIDDVKYHINLHSRLRVRAEVVLDFHNEMNELENRYGCTERNIAEEKLSPLVAGVRKRLQPKVDRYRDRRYEGIRNYSRRLDRPGPSRYMMSTRDSISATKPTKLEFEPTRTPLVDTAAFASNCKFSALSRPLPERVTRVEKPSCRRTKGSDASLDSNLYMDSDPTENGFDSLPGDSSARKIDKFAPAGCMSPAALASQDSGSQEHQTGPKRHYSLPSGHGPQPKDNGSAEKIAPVLEERPEITPGLNHTMRFGQFSAPIFPQRYSFQPSETGPQRKDNGSAERITPGLEERAEITPGLNHTMGYKQLSARRSHRDRATKGSNLLHRSRSKVRSLIAHMPSVGISLSQKFKSLRANKYPPWAGYGLDPPSAIRVHQLDFHHDSASDRQRQSEAGLEEKSYEGSPGKIVEELLGLWTTLPQSGKEFSGGD